VSARLSNRALPGVGGDLDHHRGHPTEGAQLTGGFWQEVSGEDKLDRGAVDLTGGGIHPANGAFTPAEALEREFVNAAGAPEISFRPH
jgi:hypothetical protein